jgi:hypothetical protein
MDKGKRAKELSQEGSELYLAITNFLSGNIHPGHKEPLTIERLVCGKGDFPFTHFIYLHVKNNPVHPNTVDEKWYANLKDIGRRNSVFIALPVRYSTSV